MLVVRVLCPLYLLDFELPVYNSILCYINPDVKLNGLFKFHKIETKINQPITAPLSYNSFLLFPFFNILLTILIFSSLPFKLLCFTHLSFSQSFDGGIFMSCNLKKKVITSQIVLSSPVQSYNEISDSTKVLSSLKVLIYNFIQLSLCKMEFVCFYLVIQTLYRFPDLTVLGSSIGHTSIYLSRREN